MVRDDWQFLWSHGWPETDRAGMVEVDRRMVETYGIALEKMMENAGRALATVAWRRWLGGLEAPRVTVLAGSGGNGGGALVAARRLAAWGAEVEVVLSRPASGLNPVPAGQLAILSAMGITVSDAAGEGADLILDGLCGYSLSGAPRGRLADLIAWANGSGTQILALSKRCLSDPAARWAVGNLYLADISVPPGLYAGMACPIRTPSFLGEDILRIG